MTAYIYGRWGKQPEAEQAFREALKLNRKRKLQASCFLPLSIGLGDNKEALDWLEKACAEHCPNITALKVDPIYDPLRNEPRFHAVLKQIHLAK